MIEKYTGVPGAGKTAMAIKRLLEIDKAGDRPIYVHGVPHLKIVHFPIKCRSPACDVCPSITADLPYAEDWQEWAPDGAFIFIDEAQNVFRPLSVGAALPLHIAALEIHRHRGIDFLLVTQSPKLVHSNVRRLVSKHIHLAGTWARRIQYEWGECSENLSKTSAVSSTYRIPKHVFPLYQSASLHTKLNRAIPWQVYVFGLAIVLAISAGYRIYKTRINPDKATQAQSNGLTPANDFKSAIPPTPQQSYDFVPVVPNHPESAPAYSAIVKVKDFPKLVACIKSEKKCTCYTQQATQYTVSRQECIDYVEEGRFDPYKEPTKIVPNYQPNQAKNSNNPSPQYHVANNQYTPYAEQE